MNQANQLYTTQQYLDTQPPDKDSKRYIAGEEAPSKFRQRMSIFWNMSYYIDELKNLYPYHPTIVNSHKQFHDDRKTSIQRGLVISALTIGAILQLGRRNTVPKIFNLYGRYFKSHRSARQYICALLIPTTTLLILDQFKHINNIFALWSVHIRRMQAQKTEDPDGTVYPERLQDLDIGGIYKTDYLSPLDYAKKVANQVILSQAPDYVNPQFEAVEIEEAEGEEGGEEGEDE